MPIILSVLNIQFETCQEAENDATLALNLSGSNITYKQKALFRRSRARRAQGDLTDLAGFVVHGGSQDVADREALSDPLAVDNTQALARISPTAGQEGYEIKDTALLGKESDDLQEGFRAILSAIERLPPSALVRFLSLHNAYNAKGANIFIEIYCTNALPGALGYASRFNPSCLPNARYSFHADSGQLRIFALTDIAIDEEIRVSYLSSRNVYGSTRDERRDRFLANLNFACMCTACSLEGAALKASDDRRREMPILWDRMMKHEPRFQGQRVLRDAVRAIRLLREDGYAADADDFAGDAAGLCALHSDWDSAKYWAKFSYDSRCAEFGEDHEHSRSAKVYFDNPRLYPQAGLFSGQKSPLRV
ncbi:SET domain-containing protein [Mycena galericulata]|nr:SET domain-containing protein [Mycena galericulata]